MFEIIFYSIPLILYALTVWFSYSCTKGTVKSTDEMDIACWIMIFLPLGNIGWGIGAIIQSELDRREQLK